jgi:hypothetical protein
LIFFQAGEVAKAGKCAFFALDVELKEGKDLAARDKTGTCIITVVKIGIITEARKS